MLYKDISTITKSKNPDNTPNNTVNTVSEANAINNSLRNILLTPKGSLPGKPYFGSDLHRLAFEQLDYMTEMLAQRYAEEAIIKFERRITIVRIEVINAQEYNRLMINVFYTFRDDVGRKQSSSTLIRIK